MTKMIKEGLLPENNGLIFLMDQAITTSSVDANGIWEGQLKTETIILPSGLRSSVEEYIEIIIGGSRMGVLNPAEYAKQIIQANQGLSPTWCCFSESISQAHEQMLTDSQGNDNETRTLLIEALSTKFEQVIQNAGIRHESTIGITMRGLIDKFKKFPQEI